jgi:hypothetical protein
VFVKKDITELLIILDHLAQSVMMDVKLVGGLDLAIVALEVILR